MVQEQQSKNRIMVEKDGFNRIFATVHSSTHFSKGRATIVERNRHLYVKHNSLDGLIPVLVLLKAFGMVWEQEIVLSVGTAPEFLEFFGNCIHDCHQLGIFTQDQALNYLGGRYTRRRDLDERGVSYIDRRLRCRVSSESLSMSHSGR